LTTWKRDGPDWKNNVRRTVRLWFGGFPMKDNDGKPKVNRRHFIGKMAGGILGVSVLPPGTAAPSAMDGRLQNWPLILKGF